MSETEKHTRPSVAEAIIRPLDDRVNRKSKDSVFCNLFSRPEYFFELYRVLHPEDSDITVNDLTLVTLSSMMLENRYNDLGILVRDRLLVMVEAQSSFTVNILTRFLLYLADTYNRYITRMKLNIYGSKKVTLPVPELYVIYHGERGGKPDEIHLAREIFGVEDPAAVFADVKAKIIYNSRQGDILNQYITYARVFDRQVALWGYTRQAVEETLRMCRDQHVLSEFLAEEEVADIMFTFVDEEKAKAFWEEELIAKGEERGMTKGRKEGLKEGRTESLLASISALMQSMKLTASQAMDALQIPQSERTYLADRL